jgi:murein DD-endopeptidase MepM/ murein hydrolase activator NlpD
MNDHVHINITWAKEKAKTILLSRKKIKFGIAASIGLICVCVLAGIALSTRLLLENGRLNAQVAAMNLKLIETTQESKSYADRIDDLLTQSSSQTVAFDSEKEVLVNQTLAEFNERNQLIENIMKSLGVKMQKQTPAANSGGPYLPSSQSVPSDLLLRTDKNLTMLLYTPLGRPLAGAVSSPFGNRDDPFTGEKAFHTGVDIQAKRGESIKATATGTVVEASYSGDYGHLVEIQNGNGFISRFAHLQNYKVKVGDKIKRGQVIGLAGNSGRSTGAHLHYELCLNGKPINPAPFMQTTNLTRMLAGDAGKAGSSTKKIASSNKSQKATSAKASKGTGKKMKVATVTTKKNAFPSLN